MNLVSGSWSKSGEHHERHHEMQHDERHEHAEHDESEEFGVSIGALCIAS